MWNPRCHQKQNAGPLEELIETYELLVNNDTDFPTRPASRGVSIIDLALITPDLGLLRVCEIPEEYSSLSDHKLILLELENMGLECQENQQLAMSGWSIKNLLQDKELWQAAKDKWQKSSLEQDYLSYLSTKEDLDREIKWFQRKIVELLNNHAKVTKISAYSKRWWNKEVTEARQCLVRNKRILAGDDSRKQEFR